MTNLLLRARASLLAALLLGRLRRLLQPQDRRRRLPVRLGRDLPGWLHAAWTCAASSPAPRRGAPGRRWRERRPPVLASASGSTGRLRSGLPDRLPPSEQCTNNGASTCAGPRPPRTRASTTPATRTRTPAGPGWSVCPSSPTPAARTATGSAGRTPIAATTPAAWARSPTRPARLCTRPAARVEATATPPAPTPGLQRQCPSGPEVPGLRLLHRLAATTPNESVCECAGSVAEGNACSAPTSACPATSACRSANGRPLPAALHAAAVPSAAGGLPGAADLSPVPRMQAGGSASASERASAVATGWRIPGRSGRPVGQVCGPSQHPSNQGATYPRRHRARP